MGGKKKTKWRKVPLAEFTQECEAPPAVSKNESKQDLSKDEAMLSPIPSYEELGVQYNEYGEYTDDSNMLYPPIVYNPIEMPVYMMPPDPCYYYLPAVQDYAPVPYIPQMKDTVYLLLPASALRSSHAAFDWRNRRARRRYEGYAEYAVLPEKDNYSASREEKKRSKRLECYSNPSTHSRTMNSFSEMKSLSREGQEISEKKFVDSEEPAQTTKNVKIIKNIPEIQNLKSSNDPETCGVHTPVRKTSENNSVDSLPVNQSENKYSQLARNQENVPSTKKSINFQKQAQEIKENEEITDKLKCQETEYQALILKGMNEGQGERENIDNMTDFGINTQNTNLTVNKSLGCSFNNDAKDAGEGISILNNDSGVITLSDTFVNSSDNHQNRSETEKLPNPNKVKSSSPLPDISSTWPKEVPSNQKTTNNGTLVISDKQSESPLLDKTSPPCEKFSKSRVHLSQSPYISHSINSDSSSHDAEVELKSLTNLQSLRINQSIYKLAYDESVTDQSEADSRSLSPVDPETQVPKSLANDEILIHEADSCSDAGSEDVELLPHRYESETFLNESKHVYVNKLSLAVELLRTQENLPYDEQFKRVGRNSTPNDANPDAIGEMNLGCVDDSSSFEDLKAENLITSQSQARSNPRSSGAVSNFSIEDGSCEEAKEVVVEAANTRDNSEGVRANYRRFQVQFRHYFTPRAALVNPCLCCIIM